MGISFGFISLLGYSPSTNPFISLIFVIPNYAVYLLFLLAMNGFAKYYDEPKIFKNSLYAFIVSISGGIASFIGTTTFVTPILDQLSTYITGPGNFPPISVISSMLQADYLGTSIYYWHS